MITLLKVKVGIEERFLEKINNDLGKIIKIETNPRDKLEIVWHDIESIQNRNVKPGWIYVYCDERV